MSRRFWPARSDILSYGKSFMTQKLITDTDPGIDDAMAIHMAFADPRIEVVGLDHYFR